MPGFPDYARYDGLGLAELVRRREVVPLDLVEEAIRRIEALNPQVNAVVHRMYDAARAATRGPLGDGPFAGVPFLLKDLLSTYAGEPMSSGSRLFDGWIAPHDAEYTIRLKRAGFVIVGKTSTPELGLTPVTEPLRFGPTRNPWDLGRTAGGSSGGSAAAVASGMVPIASGGDGGGSIRIPSACCGCFGLKPTRGRLPTGPDDGERWQGCAVEHVITRSVRDSAAVLDATHGADPGAPYHAPPPARPFLEEVGAPPGRLRIAFSRKPPIPAEVHPEYVALVESVAELCADLGHDVEEGLPEIDGAAFSRNFVLMLLGETAADIREGERIVGRKARARDVEPGTMLLALLGERQSGADYAAAVRDLFRVARPVGRFFERYDVLLTPTLAKPPILIGELMPKGFQLRLLEVLTRLRAGRTLKALGALEKVVHGAWGFTPFTAVFNVTGQPAASVPLGWSADGLPLGAQIVARFGDEATIFRLAAELEEARPWRERRPPLGAL
jgi:amidase